MFQAKSEDTIIQHCVQGSKYMQIPLASRVQDDIW